MKDIRLVEVSAHSPQCGSEDLPIGNACQRPRTPERELALNAIALKLNTCVSQLVKSCCHRSFVRAEGSDSAACRRERARIRSVFVVRSGALEQLLRARKCRTCGLAVCGAEGLAKTVEPELEECVAGRLLVRQHALFQDAAQERLWVVLPQPAGCSRDTGSHLGADLRQVLQRG